MIRKAVDSDIPAVAEIYEKIHRCEQAGRVQTGWIPDVYPVEDTAKAAHKRDELFVYEKNGKILAAAIINQTQVDVYAKGDWTYPAEASQIMVLHTLVVDPNTGKQGIGRKMVAFYEAYAWEKGCSVLRMDTNVCNVMARTMYHKLGYQEAGIVSCIFNGIPDVQLVLLEKKREEA
jgi:GNAT superfamily N-acetyltransferase